MTRIYAIVTRPWYAIMLPRIQKNAICDCSWQLKCLRLCTMAKSKAGMEMNRVDLML